MRERVHVHRVLAATLRRSLAEQSMAVVPNLMYLASLSVGLLSQAFLGRVVDSAPNAVLGAYQGHFAAFLLVGVALLDLQNAAVGGLSRALREAQVTGSLENLLMTPTPMGVLLLALACPPVAGSLVRMVVYGCAGPLLFGLPLAGANALGAVTTLVVALAAFAGFALVAAALTMVLRRGDPASRLLAATSVIAGGVFYPTSVLPAWTAHLGRWLPITSALEALRAALLHGAGPIALAAPLGRLAVIGAVAGALGAWAFAKAAARARVDGALTAW